MKRLIVLIIIFLNVNLFAKEPVLILKKDSVIEDTSGNEKMFSKGDRFLFGRKVSNGSEMGFGVDLWDPLTIEIYFRDSNGKAYSSNINDVYLEDNNLKIDTDIKNSHWIPSYYYELLESRNAKSKLLEYESYWNNFENFTSDPDLTWFDCFTVQRFYFDDFYFVYFGKYYYYDDVDFLAYLEEVSDTKIVYDVQKMYSHYFEYYLRSPLFNHPDFIPLYEKETPFKVILTLDGDYMKMYIDEVSEENLFQILVRTTPEACDQIEKWIKGESYDLSKVVMPRSSSVGKTMTVSENLRLRSGEATTSDVVTVLQAGTRVKILEVGKAETIDGISSNWVKVKVRAGAKDRDGKTITKGTVGWCFGGYLK